jgi:hypothetical protein
MRTSIMQESPSGGLARGIFPAPRWVVAGAAIIVVLAIVAFFLARHYAAKQRTRRTRALDSVAPPSSRK